MYASRVIVLINSFEGTATGTATSLAFSGRSREIIVLNDGAADLTLTISGKNITLKAGEELNADVGITAMSLITGGSSVAYRVWVWG